MLLDDLLRVPLIVAPAARNAVVPGGARRVSAPTSSVDLMDTLLSLASADVPGSHRGRAMMDAEGQLFPNGARDAVFTEWDEDGQGLTRSLRCVRTARHKLIRYASDPERTGELYDLLEDPLEACNRFADPSFADIRRALEERLRKEYGDRLECRPAVPREAPW